MTDPNIPPLQEAQQIEQKPERKDELDIFGGLIIKLIKGFFNFYRRLFKSQQYQ